jgi:hypothetical protein
MEPARILADPRVRTGRAGPGRAGGLIGGDLRCKLADFWSDGWSGSWPDFRNRRGDKCPLSHRGLIRPGERNSVQLEAARAVRRL